MYTFTCTHVSKLPKIKRSNFSHIFAVFTGLLQNSPVRPFQSDSESRCYCLDEIVVLYILKKHVNISL